MATQSADTTVAINEHALAAGEFARAATGTRSAEALRTLRLLEQHHQRLSELLRSPAETPAAAAPAETEGQQAVAEKPGATSAAVAELRASKSDLGPSPLPRHPPSLHLPRRLPPRDLSSSIASNLASARGIRANHVRQPLSPSVSTQQAAGGLEALPRRDGSRSKVPASIPEDSQPSWLPPARTSPRQDEPRLSVPVAAVPSAHEEGFSRFYNTFESILSKLSAPLAFAGLPLLSEEVQAPAPEPSKGKPRPQRERCGSDPDLTKYISRAALRASARDGHSGNDSFYVVPTGGGTIPYAAIVSYEQKEKRRMAASVHSENADLFADPNDHDDFVDARETPMPASPSASRRSTRRKLSSREVERQVEELDMENKSLKDYIDKLSKRLHAFEMSAQQNSMALQESMRLTRTMSPARELSGRGDEGLKQRLAELEEHVSRSGKEVDRLGRENEKLKSVIIRYRDRWEKLKEGAKTRRDASANKDAAPGTEVPKTDADPGTPRFMAG